MFFKDFLVASLGFKERLDAGRSLRQVDLIAGSNPENVGIDLHLYSFAIFLVGSAEAGRRSRFRKNAFTATMALDPDMEIAAISGLSLMPNPE